MLTYNIHVQFCTKLTILIDIDNDTIHFTVKNLTFMDILLTKIGGKIISYATF